MDEQLTTCQQCGKTIAIRESVAYRDSPSGQGKTLCQACAGEIPISTMIPPDTAGLSMADNLKSDLGTDSATSSTSNNRALWVVYGIMAVIAFFFYFGGTLYEALDTSISSIKSQVLSPTPVGQITFLAEYQDERRFLTANPYGSGSSIMEGCRSISSGECPECPQMSPNQEKIVYLSHAQGQGDLFLTDTWNWEMYEKYPVQNLTKSSDNEGCAAWSPDGTKLLFTRDNSRGNDIFVMNSDGTGLRNLTRTEDQDPAVRHYISPSPWSPAGSQLVFSSDQDGDFDIYVMDLDGTQEQHITVDPSSGFDFKRPSGGFAREFAPVWSPTGSTIAFVSEGIGGNADIFVLDLSTDGAMPVNVTAHPAFDDEPTWSPDGGQLIFVSDRSPDQSRRLYMMNRDGTHVKMLRLGSAFGDVPEIKYEPHWLPPLKADGGS